MNKKKVLVLILTALAVCFSACFSACQRQQEGYVLVAPDGAPALAIACLGDKIVAGDTEYKINKKIVAPSVVNSEALQSDLAIVPSNLAAKIYNEGGDVKLLAVVTNGNLFALSALDTAIEDISALAGKLVYSIGQNSAPDMIFKTLLSDKGISYRVGEESKEGVVTIKYCALGAEVNALLLLAKQRGEDAYGVLAEPDVQKGKAAGLGEVFDLQSLWSAQNGGQYAGYAQAVLIAKSSVAENEEFVSKLLDSFAKNGADIRKDPQLAIANIKSVYPQTTLSDAITSDVISRCNIDVVTMPSGREYFESTLNAISAINAKLIGGVLPDDGFYYAAK